MQNQTSLFCIVFDLHYLCEKYNKELYETVFEIIHCSIYRGSRNKYARSMRQ